MVTPSLPRIDKTGTGRSTAGRRCWRRSRIMRWAWSAGVRHCFELGRRDAATAVIDDILARDPKCPSPHARIDTRLGAGAPRRRSFTECDSAASRRCCRTGSPIRGICHRDHPDLQSCLQPLRLVDEAARKKERPLDTYRHVIEQVATITTNPIRLHIDGEPTKPPPFRGNGPAGEQSWVADLARPTARVSTRATLTSGRPGLPMSTLPEELGVRQQAEVRSTST